MKQWSRKYKDCIQCSGNGRPYKGKGLCVRCYDKYRQVSSSKRTLWQRKYRLNNLDKVRESQKRYHAKNREKLFSALGATCKNCGFSDIRALQIDHINGGGIKERRTINTKDFHRVVLKSVINNENKYQLLCANCNWIKRTERQEWGGAKRTK